MEFWEIDFKKLYKNHTLITGHVQAINMADREVFFFNSNDVSKPGVN